MPASPHFSCPDRLWFKNHWYGPSFCCTPTSLLRTFSCTFSVSSSAGVTTQCSELPIESLTALPLKILFLKENYNLCFYSFYPIGPFSPLRHYKQRVSHLQHDHLLGACRQLSGICLLNPGDPPSPTSFCSWPQGIVYAPSPSGSSWIDCIPVNTALLYSMLLEVKRKHPPRGTQPVQHSEELLFILVNVSHMIIWLCSKFTKKKHQA